MVPPLRRDADGWFRIAAEQPRADEYEFISAIENPISPQLAPARGEARLKSP
jgi:hypothetical protein